MGSTHPLFLARGIWQAHQQRTQQDNTGQNHLPWKALLSCVLGDHFKIKDSKLRPQDLAVLCSLAQSNPYFKCLDFFRISIDLEGVNFISRIAHLKDLTIEEGNLTDTSLKTLMSRLSLTRLILSKNKITSQGIKALQQNSCLQELSLYKNKIGDDGAESLSQHPSLRILDLRRCDIGDRGAKALAKNGILRSLRLRYNNITDDSVLDFFGNQHLTHLEIANNNVPKELVHWLENVMLGNGHLHLLNGLGVNHPQPGGLPTKSRVRILSIDGGGIRGLLPALILKYVADEINKQLQVSSERGFHFAKHIDLMAGTSTGGLICLGLSCLGEQGRPKYTPDTLVNLYQKEGADIFPATWSSWSSIQSLARPKYNPKPLEDVLTSYFAGRMLSSCLCRILITAHDLEQNTSRLFDSRRALKDRNENFEIRGVARATSAAPTYFPAACIKNQEGEDYTFIDGGIYANNPTLLALKRAKQLYPKAKEYLVISLGTGICDSQGQDKHLKNAGLVKWGLNITDTLMSSKAHYTSTLLKEEIDADPRIHYIRIQPQLQASETKMDNTKRKNVDKLILAAKQAIQQYQKPLQDLIKEFLRDYGSVETP